MTSNNDEVNEMILPEIPEEGSIESKSIGALLDAIGSKKELIMFNDRFIDAGNNVKEKYKILKALATHFLTPFLDEKELIKIRNTLDRFNGIYTLKDATKKGQKEGSKNYREIKPALKQLNETLNTLFEITSNTIVKLLKSFRDLFVVHGLKINVIQAVGDAKGKFDLYTSSKEVDNLTKQYDDAEINLIQYIKGPEFQPKTKIFYMNQQEKKKQEKEQKGEE